MAYATWRGLQFAPPWVLFRCTVLNYVVYAQHFQCEMVSLDDVKQ